MNAEPKADAHQRNTTTDAGLTKFDPATLKAIESTAMVASNGTAFLPATMAEAMELGKLMSLSNFVPPHLRSQPGDCLAVVLQASRWGMDPFAVANKTYFVQERMAYESQLVNAVLNARAPLEGRLHVEWDGEGNLLTCKVTGKIKGDPNLHTIWQEIATITTKNSPLWKTAPRQQLAYFTTRMWARLFCPEVLLGVYTEDEARDMGPIQEVIPPRPTQGKLAKKIAAANEEQARKDNLATEKQYRDTMAEDPKQPSPEAEPEPTDPEHDPETGEIQEPEPTSESTPAATPAKPSNTDHVATERVLLRKISALTTKAAVEAIPVDWKTELDAMQAEDNARFHTIMKALNEKRMKFKK